MCKICSTPSEPFGNAVILSKYNIQYFRCPSCGTIETEEPFWLAESYTSAIAASDVGLVRRNMQLAEVTHRLLDACFPGDGPFVDYGGGYGMFVRMMRDAGFDFRLSDKYCENLFAKGFEVDANGSQRFEVLTAFEVFEHLVDPRRELATMLRLSDSILFTTVLAPTQNPPLPSQWWYYTLDSGQHVTLYTCESLNRLAQHAGLNFYTSGFVHLFTTRSISNIHFLDACKGHPDHSSLFRRSTKSSRRSLIEDDYERITGRSLK